jgi:formyl-CoA transferase
MSSGFDQETHLTRPLDGIRVVDTSTGIAGPYCTMLLSDMGADVVVVEPLDDNPDRNDPVFHQWHRGQRSLSLDLGQDEGRQVLGRLLEKADVFIASFPPSRVADLALEYEPLAARNPRLVYCALPPWGESGPLAEQPADDAVIGAYSGIHGDQGGVGNPPAYTVMPIPSYSAAFHAAYGICAALFVREIEGHGQRVDMPLLNAALSFQSGGFIDLPDRPAPIPKGRWEQQGYAPVYRLYQCADGRWIFAACGHEQFWNKLCLAIDRVDLLADPRFANAPWLIAAEDDNRAALIRELTAWFKTKPSEEWLRILEEGDVPAGPVMGLDEMYGDPQVLHNGMVAQIADPALGPTRQLAMPVRFFGTPGAATGPAPRQGQHTQKVLAELGYSAAEVAALRQKRVI